MVTPFDESGERIDFASLERLLRAQDAAGNGVILLGSTGESLALRDRERRAILRFATQLGLSIPLMSGVPSHNIGKEVGGYKGKNSFNIIFRQQTEQKKIKTKKKYKEIKLLKQISYQHF
jgi:4-hydroxy-tetrahydrodipicolinate synthase